MEVSIEGYGSIVVEKSEIKNDDDFSDLVADVVAKVMNLVSPVTQEKRFHPVIGFGEYANQNSRGTS